MALKPGGIKAIVGLLIVVGFWAVVWGPLNFIIPKGTPTESVIPKQATLVSMPMTPPERVEIISMPSDNVVAGNPFKINLWAWNSQIGQLFANGGPRTTEGSIMAKNGVNVKFERLDDAEKMKSDLVATAKAMSDGNYVEGTNTVGVQIMGDGYAAFIAGLNDALVKIGPEYKAISIGSAGFSVGEDGFWGPTEWKKNPQLAKGGVVSGYLRDGDWNIAIKWLSENGIKNNPDETTYDPEALNWVAASDYIDACNKYITGYEEDRPVVSKGKKTGETKHIAVQAVVTWTPGDVLIAKERGGIVPIVTTREYSGQMPNAIIVIKKWAYENESRTLNFLKSVFEGNLQVLNHEEALYRGGEISAKVYGEQNAEYWVKYYRGTQELDKQGIPVKLGGSRVNTLADNLVLFGPQQAFASTYRTFGDIVVQQYPKLVPSYPPAEEVIDGYFINKLAAQSGTTTQTAQKYKFTESSSLRDVTGNVTYNIQFRSESSEILPGQERELQKLKDQLTIGSALKIVIHGHTDNTGNVDQNMALSEERAFAVKSYLENKYPDVFPINRIAVVAHGQMNPVASNATVDGRAKNRRVEIITGTY